MDKYEKQHQRNLSAYERQVDAIFNQAIKEAALIGISVGELADDEILSFDKLPKTKKAVSKMMNTLASSLTVCIVNGVQSSWTLANNKDSELCDRVFGDAKDSLNEAQRKRYYSNNGDALQAFLSRKEAGLNLSERVWKYVEEYKEEIELGLDLGLRDGVAAERMQRDLQQYLQHPDMLFRRVRDVHGHLQLSKRARAYHPGAGVYRSSYKNARRLTVTETNMAYRTADYLRWQELDFVVGIRVVLSNNHPEDDICNVLSAPMDSTATEGRGCYPKDFKFTGWHPHCRCHSESILKTEEELMADNKRIMRGEEPSTESVNTVSDVPYDFKDWIKDNANRIVKAKSLPYFVTDNVKTVAKIMQKAQPNAIVAEQMQRTANFDEYTLYFKRHSDKVAQLLLEYEKRNTDIGKAIILNQIKHECAVLTNQALVASGHIGTDWTWARTEFDAVVQNKATYTVGNKIVKLDEVKMDILVYKDNEGREFSYAIGLNKFLFKATEASTAIQELPPYLRKGIKRVTFYDMECPTDPYWKVKYNNPKHRSMATDGGKVTFYLTPQSTAEFKEYITHEAGHIIDQGKHRLSASKGWQEACAKDETLHANIKQYRVSSYAETNDAENFAECVRAYYNNHDAFKQMFPNCAAYIRQTARKLSGHFRTP